MNPMEDSLGMENSMSFPQMFAYTNQAHITLVSYDGEWVIVVQPGTGTQMCVRSWHAGLVCLGTSKLTVAITAYANNDKSIYWFFYEPFKGDYSNYQGFETDAANYYAKSRKAGVQTQTDISPQNWTVETMFGIQYDESAVDGTYFYIDGALEASHGTNLSAPPFEAIFGESKAVARTFHIKYPPGIRHNRYG